MFEDYYCLLQVHPEAEPEIIQSAYKRLCKKYHPDVNHTPQAIEQMKKINAAYEILSDEGKRRRYHADWKLRSARPGAAPPPPRVEVRERVVYVRPEPVRFGGGTQGAYEAVYNYFDHLAGRRYREAYALVSDADKKNFTYGSFVEWQDSVSALYEIGSVKMTLFKRHPQFKLGGDARAQAEEFVVSITEKTRGTGIVSEYSVNKYAVLETPFSNNWRIYLGYQDLTPLMLQFRTVVNQAEVQMVGVWERYKETTDLSMGLPNRAGFEKRVEEEAYRYRRYHRPFSAAALRVILPERVVDSVHRERVIRYTGYIISKSIRPIDHVAYFGDNVFGVLLAETNRASGTQAARRLLKAVRHDIAACFDFEIDIRAGVNEYDGREVPALIHASLSAAGVYASQVGSHVGAAT